MDIAVQNVSVVAGDDVRELMDVGVQNGLIEVIAPRGNLDANIIIDGTGLYLMPAFADMHCHLREPGFTHKEDICTGAQSAAAGGYTDICCMPNTKPVLDSVALIKDVLRIARNAVIRVHPVAAITKGMHGRTLTNFERLKRAGAIAFSDDGLPVSSMEVMIAAMQQSILDDVLLMAHEEDLEIRGSGVAHAGPHAACAGLCGIPRESEDSMVERDLFIAKTNGGHLHLCHVSTAGAVAMIRKAKTRDNSLVTCETAPHYFSLTDTSVRTRDSNMKVNPPLREEHDRHAVIRGLMDGTIDVIATDHAPHSDDEKSRSFEDAPFGMIGFETAFSAAITYLYQPRLLTLPHIARLMSTAPRRILGLPGGTLAPGCPADMVLCDVDSFYDYRREDIVSRAHNSPFIGQRLAGRVVTTIMGGEIVYDRSSAASN